MGGPSASGTGDAGLETLSAGRIRSSEGSGNGVVPCLARPGWARRSLSVGTATLQGLGIFCSWVSQEIYGFVPFSISFCSLAWCAAMAIWFATVIRRSISLLIQFDIPVGRQVS